MFEYDIKSKNKFQDEDFQEYVNMKPYKKFMFTEAEYIQDKMEEAMA